MNTQPEPYGDAAIQRQPDGTITVLQADDRIGVHLDLWEQMGTPHRRDTGELWLDTAATYRYRHVGYGIGDVLVFERITEDVAL